MQRRGLQVLWKPRDLESLGTAGAMGSVNPEFFDSPTILGIFKNIISIVNIESSTVSFVVPKNKTVSVLSIQPCLIWIQK